MTKQKVMALGFFDGIHVGHAALINMIKQRADETGAEPAVLTFDVHPDNLVFNKTMHPQAQAHWFEASKAQNLDKWVRVADKAVKKFGTD